MKLKNTFLTILVLFLGTSVFSENLFNTGTIVRPFGTEKLPTGNIVAAFEDYNHVTYLIRFTYVDSSDSYHSKPLYIGGCNTEDGYVMGIQSTTGDANVIYHFSADNRTNWETTTPADLDALSGTAVGDTIGIEVGVDDIKFHTARWLVVEFASGSSTNADDNELTFVIKLKKNNPALIPNGEAYRVARIVGSSETNP